MKHYLLIVLLTTFTNNLFAQQDSTIIGYDRFGNGYTIEEVSITPPPPLVAPMAAPANAQCSAGIFDLDFVDVGNGVGFFDISASQSGSSNYSTLGEERQAIVCQMFTDLSELITSTPDPCDPNQIARVRVEIIGDYAFTNGGLAKASAFYYNSDPNGSGIVEGAVWENINTGVDMSPGLLDARMEFDFINNNFYSVLDISSISPVPPPITSLEHDLYSVALHEAFHTLGFNSFLTDAAQSTISNDFIGNFTGYDLLLRYNNAPMVVQNFLTSTFDIANVPPTSVLGLGPCTDVTIQGTNVILEPIHTPNPFAIGTSLSHFENTCAAFPPQQYLMRPGLATATFLRSPLTLM